MPQIFTILNQKGGVGKSTTAHALGAGLMRRGFRVLFIDLDAQGNLSSTLGADTQGVTAHEVLVQRMDAERAIQHLPQGDAIASSPALSGMDTVLTAVGKEYRLREALAPISGEYDFILVDTPPSLGVLTVNALTACTGAIIPAQADIYSLQGIAQLHTTIDTVRQYCNPHLRVLGILLTRYSARAVLSRDLADVIGLTAQRLETRLYQTTIRESIAIREAQANQADIFTYAPKSNAALDYDAWVDEVLRGLDG